MERRRHRRYAKRFKVRFGEKELIHSGFTGDVSATGMFLVTGNIPNLGTRLHVEVTMDLDRLLYFEGVVARQTLVQPELRQIMRGGFGLRFLSPVELMAEMVPHLRDKTQVVLRYETVATLHEAWDKELNRGGAFVWSDINYPANTIINIEFDLPFVRRQLSFEARVVHVLEQGGRFGIALIFLDVPGATAALGSVLQK